VQVLSRALNWAMGDGLAPANPAAKLKPLHFSDRSDVIWGGPDIQAFIAAARGDSDPADYIAPEALALMGACYSGLSRQDLCALTWPQVGPHAITGKRLKAARRARTAGKKARTIVIPRTSELDAVLAICERRAAEWEKKDGVKRLHVFLNSRGKPWTPDGLTSSFNKARDKGGPVGPGGKPTPIADAEGRPKRLHDARGTFVTHMRMRMPDVTNAELAKMVGWEEEDVERIATRYVDADRIALAWLERLKRGAGS
jgi:integrase